MLIYTIIALGVQLIYTHSEPNTNFPKYILDITCQVINNTPKIVTEKIGAHSFRELTVLSKSCSMVVCVCLYA